MSSIQYFSDRDAEKLANVDARITFLNDNQATVALYADLAAAKAELVALDAALEAEGIRRSKLKKSNRGVKAADQEKVAQAVFVAQKALMALGRKQKIAELQNLTTIPMSELVRIRYVALKDHGVMILGLLNKYKLQLTDSTYNEEDIAAFEALLNEFKLILSTIDTEHSLGVESTAEIDLKFTKLEEVMDTLDDLVDSLMLKQPQFYREYKQVCKVIHYGIRHEDEEETPPPAPAPENPGSPQ